MSLLTGEYEEVASFSLASLRLKMIHLSNVSYIRFALTIIIKKKEIPRGTIKPAEQYGGSDTSRHSDNNSSCHNGYRVLENNHHLGHHGHHGHRGHHGHHGHHSY